MSWATGVAVVPTTAAQSCGSALGAGGVPFSVKSSAPSSNAALSGRLKVRWSNGFVSPQG